MHYAEFRLRSGIKLSSHSLNKHNRQVFDNTIHKILKHNYRIIHQIPTVPYSSHTAPNYFLI